MLHIFRLFFVLLCSSSFQVWADTSAANRTIETELQQFAQQMPYWGYEHIKNAAPAKFGETIEGAGTPFFSCKIEKISKGSVLYRLSCVNNVYAFFVGQHASYYANYTSCQRNMPMNGCFSPDIVVTAYQSETSDEFGRYIKKCSYSFKTHIKGYMGQEIAEPDTILSSQLVNVSSRIQVAQMSLPHLPKTPDNFETTEHCEFRYK